MKRVIGSVVTASLVAAGLLIGAAPSYASSLPECTTQAGLTSQPATSGGSTDCILWNGTSGDGVKALQTSLADCNGFSLAIDGQFGPATRAAVEALQSRAGISVDGVYGPQTGAHMSILLEGDATPMCTSG
jgi:hypothetical protein